MMYFPPLPISEKKYRGMNHPGDLQLKAYYLKVWNQSVLRWNSF